jgi:rubrerythrin
MMNPDHPIPEAWVCNKCGEAYMSVGERTCPFCGSIDVSVLVPVADGSEVR